MVTVNAALLPWQRHRQLAELVAHRVIACAVAVTRHLGEDLPPTTVTLTTHAGLAWLHVAAYGEGATLKARVRYFWEIYREARDAVALAVAVPGDAVHILVNSAALSTCTRSEVDSYLAHELVHAVQFARPGQHARLVAGALHNLGLQRLTDRELAHGEAACEAFEAEAYQVQHALFPIAT